VPKGQKAAGVAELNTRGAMEHAQRLSDQLRAAEDRIEDLQAEVKYYQERVETSSLTADPKLHIPNAFRTCRQGIHDAISGGTYTATICKAKNLKTWITCSPDYAYGRRAASKIEYESAKRDFLLQTSVGAYAMTGHWWRRRYWYCRL
jgi:hypothetical protein